VHRPDPLDFRQSPTLQFFRPKNVDEWLEHNVSDAEAIFAGECSERFLWCRPPSKQQLSNDLPFLGKRDVRERAWERINVPEEVRGKRLADELNALADTARREARRTEIVESLSDGEKLRIRKSEINLDGIIRERDLREEFDALEREYRDVRSRLPDELGVYLDRMHPARRHEREDAIRTYVGLEDLPLIKMSQTDLAITASVRAERHSKKFPATDRNGKPLNQSRFHKRRRCEKWQRRNLRKRQVRALLYAEAAVGAVVGPAIDGRPLYVSDYTLETFKEKQRRTTEVLEGLRLVCVDDPSIQIPMKDLNERKKLADAAKRRLLMDATLARIEGLGWHLCWITITLPGEYVPNSTNESHRVADWNPEFGPTEALNEIQRRHHQTMCLLRERGIRPIGFWNAQAQQSGTPHRHLLLACPTLADARAVCDGFWRNFSSTSSDERQAEARKADPGCRAYVVDDTDPKYAPPKGRDGRTETASSIAKYMSRYATRFLDQDIDVETDTDLLRHAAWASFRRARTHSWIGLDAGRSPMALWDTLWAKASRSDEKSDPEHPRMRLAIRMMRKTQESIDTIAELRRQQATLDGEDLEYQRDFIRAESSKAANHAWHSGIALGLWPDRDLAPQELEWLREETAALDPQRTAPPNNGKIQCLGKHGVSRTIKKLDIMLPPMPLRDVRESVYGDRSAVTIGAVAPEALCILTKDQFRNAASIGWIAKLLKIDLEPTGPDMELNPSAIRRAFRRAGIQFSPRPDGSFAGFSLTSDTVLRTEKEWIITDVESNRPIATAFFVLRIEIIIRSCCRRY
jgi:hypothetical protein